MTESDKSLGRSTAGINQQQENIDQIQTQPGGLIHLSSTFKPILGAVLTITFACLILMTALAVFIKEPNDQVKSVLETCSTTFKLGVGAVLGLISGKTAQ